MFVEQKSDLTMNIFTRTITDKNGNHLYLTSKEFDLFYFLYSYRGQVFTKEQLYENVWGYDYAPDAKNLISFIRKLRKKMNPTQTSHSTSLRSGVWGINSQKTYKSKVDHIINTLLLLFIFHWITEMIYKNFDVLHCIKIAFFIYIFLFYKVQ